MSICVRPAAIALVLVTATGAAQAQTWAWEPDTVAVAPAPVVPVPRALQLTPAQRTTIYRTIVPQGRGRAPVIRERVVIESVAPAPVVRERIVTRPAPQDYAYDAYGSSDYSYAGDYAYAPDARVAGYTVGSRIPAAVSLRPLPAPIVAEVPVTRGYRYMMINGRLLLVDPVTSVVVADLTDY